MPQKRQRPWAATTSVVSLIIAASSVDALPFLGGVFSDSPVFDTIDWDPTPQIRTPAPSPTTSGLDTELFPWNPTSTSPAVAPSEMIRKEAVGIVFDLELEYSGTSATQLTKDVDGVLENYILDNVRKNVTTEGLEIRDVMLNVTLTRRRRLQATTTRDVVVRVDGNVLYDIIPEGCVECVDENIERKLDEILTLEAVDALMRNASIEGLVGVTGLRDAPADDDNRGVDSVQKDDNNGKPPLERPSTLSIVFGFVLTGIAALGLVFYAYIFWRKRQKRLRKEKQQREQQREQIEFRMPPSAVRPLPPITPTAGGGAGRISQRVSPSGPLPPPRDLLPALADDFSEGSSFKGLATMSSDGGPADSFARELQMAANLDQQAWEDFQRKKRALDRNRELPSYGSPLGSTSPVPPPPNSQDPTKNRHTWTKSFPYGDESSTMEEQGVELTTHDFGGTATAIPITTPSERGTGSREVYSSRVSSSLPEEKKDDYASRMASRDLEPESPPRMSGETSAVLQSIERTLSQFGTTQQNENFFQSDDDPNETVDEIARLSRFVQRYEKRKERQKQRESGQFRTSTSPTESSSSYSPYGSAAAAPSIPISTGPKLPKQHENNGYLNNMKSRQTVSHEAPRTSFMAINMAGGMYQDASMENINHRPAVSMSDDSDDDSYPADEGGLKSPTRLGITPFSVQKAKAPPAFGSKNIASPQNAGVTSKSMNREEPTSRSTKSSFSQDNNNNRMERPRTETDRSSFQSHRSRLSDLRANSAIIDSTGSEVNVGNFPAPGTTTPTKTRIPEPQRQQQRAPNFSSPAKVTTTPSRPSPNPEFDKLRNLWRGRPSSSIFPPSENWQSGIPKNAI